MDCHARWFFWSRLYCSARDERIRLDLFATSGGRIGLCNVHDDC